MLFPSEIDNSREFSLIRAVIALSLYLVNELKRLVTIESFLGAFCKILLAMRGAHNLLLVFQSKISLATPIRRDLFTTGSFLTAFHKSFLAILAVHERHKLLFWPFNLIYPLLAYRTSNHTTRVLHTVNLANILKNLLGPSPKFYDKLSLL